MVRRRNRDGGAVVVLATVESASVATVVFPIDGELNFGIEGIGVYRGAEVGFGSGLGSIEDSSRRCS